MGPRRVPMGRAILILEHREEGATSPGNATADASGRRNVETKPAAVDRASLPTASVSISLLTAAAWDDALGWWVCPLFASVFLMPGDPVKGGTKDMKEVIISVAGTNGKGDHRDVQLMPGTRPRDVLDKLGLDGFEVNRPEGGRFALNDDLYAAVADGQKLFVTKGGAEAGTSGAGRVEGAADEPYWFASAPRDPARPAGRPVVGPATTFVVGPAAPVVIEPVSRRAIRVKPSAASVRVAPRAAVVVEATPRAVWDDRGWTVSRRGGREVYEGVYRLRKRNDGDERDAQGADRDPERSGGRVHRRPAGRGSPPPEVALLPARRRRLVPDELVPPSPPSR